MKHFKFECINKQIDNDLIKNALKNNFILILGARGNGKEYVERMRKKNEPTRKD